MLVTWGSTSRVTRSRSHPIPGIPGIPSPRVADRQSIFVAPTKITDGTAIWVCLKIVYPFLNPMVLPIMKSLFFMAISLGIYPTFSDKAISPHFPAVFGWKTADHWDLLTTSRLPPGLLNCYRKAPAQLLNHLRNELDIQTWRVSRIPEHFTAQSIFLSCWISKFGVSSRGQADNHWSCVVLALPPCFFRMSSSKPGPKNSFPPVRWPDFDRWSKSMPRMVRILMDKKPIR